MVWLPAQTFPYPFNTPYQGVVDANGELEITFGPSNNELWDVKQISFEMPDAPSGSTAIIKYQGSLVAPAFSARKAAIAGDPPLFLKGGETASVRWENCTTGDVGEVLVIYTKQTY